MNPYLPSAAADAQAEFRHSAFSHDREITATIRYSSDHLIEALSRYRSQHTLRKVFGWIRGLIGLAFLVLALLDLLSPPYKLFAILLPLAILLFVPHKIDNFLMRRRLRASPHNGELLTITISSSGLKAVSELQDVHFSWKALTAAVDFPDGILIFHGKQMFHWIPYNSLRDSDDQRILLPFVRAKIAENHTG